MVTDKRQQRKVTGREAKLFMAGNTSSSLCAATLCVCTGQGHTPEQLITEVHSSPPLRRRHAMVVKAYTLLVALMCSVVVSGFYAFYNGYWTAIGQCWCGACRRDPQWLTPPWCPPAQMPRGCTT